MNPNININDSVIDFAYLTICFKEFLDKSQLVLNDLEKKNSNSDNSNLHEAFKQNNNNNKLNYIEQKKELTSGKISNNDKNLKIRIYFGNYISFNDIEQIEIIFEMLLKFSNKIKNEINQMLVNLKIIYQKETIIILGKKIDLVADINAKDKKGLTPLHYSFINNDERMINLF
jgi:hypothetical protein